MTSRIRVGNAFVTRVVEHQFWFTAALFPQTADQDWTDNADLLVPAFYDPDNKLCRVIMQSWVVEVDGLTVVVDTGVGNGRDRPHLPALDHLATEFPAALAAAGVDPNDVDVVINTHLHTDHVGWNTHLVDDGWAPTFPNARYLLPEADYRHLGPDGPGSTDALRIVFADSIFPVADQTRLFSGDHQISESLCLRTAAGHTPGSSVLWLDAGSSAVFVGDLTHCPIQIPRPDDPCAFDINAAEAVATRKRVFTEASRRRAVVIPAHYPGRGGARLVARGDRFAVDEWLDLEPI